MSSYTTMFLTHYSHVVNWVLRYGVSVDVAEDVAQDVFVQLWERRATIDPERSVKSYLLMAARNRLFNVLAHDNIVRQHTEQAVAEQGTDRADAVASSADEMLLLDELTQTVARGVARLSPRQREIYHLSRDDGLTANEIGQMLGITAQTVYVQLGRIVRALYPILERWIADPD